MSLKDAVLTSVYIAVVVGYEKNKILNIATLGKRTLFRISFVDRACTCTCLCVESYLVTNETTTTPKLMNVNCLHNISHWIWIFFHCRCIILNWTDSHAQVRSLYCLIWVLVPPVVPESYCKGHSFSQLEFKGGDLIDWLFSAVVIQELMKNNSI